MRLLIALAMALSVAHAVDIPQSSTRDQRIQYVNYHSGDVVVVHASIGYVSRIVLQAGETVLTPVHTGFPDGWDITARGRIVTIKPMSVPLDQNTTIRPNPEEWNTNLAIETNKRLYDFEIRLLSANDREHDYQAFYRVEFRYPIEAKQQVRDASIEKGVPALPTPRNTQYTMRLGKHSEGIAPTMAYDDGLFTYLRFPNNREVPAVFITTADGVEGRVNTHMLQSRRDVLVVQRVARELILRLGESVVAINNEAFDIDGQPPVNGTRIDGQVRGDKR